MRTHHGSVVIHRAPEAASSGVRPRAASSAVVSARRWW